MRCKIVIPSSGIVELNDDVDISLTFQIADIKDPQKRHADFSKTITIPGSHNNNKMFQSIFDVGIDRQYDPNKKAACLLMADSTTIMKGYMRLKNIINVDKKISYEIEITGRLADLFTVLGDSKLKDLSWSDLDHVYNRPNQIASWSGAVGSGYVYPFIDYGYTINEIDYEVNHFFPATYVKEIWDRIMMWAGFQVSSPTSGFFTSNYWKRLIIPFNSDKMRLTNAQIEARRFQASRTSAVSYSATIGGGYQYSDIVFNDDSTSPNVDSANAYNTTTGIWTCPNSGYYNIAANVNLRGKIVVSAGANGDVYFYAYVRLIDVTNTIPQVALYSQISTFACSTLNTGTTYNGSAISFNPTTNGSTIYIAAGTQVKCQVVVSPVQYSTATVTSASVEIDTTSKIFNKPDPEIKEGDTVTMANAVPQEMTMKDFVNGIIKMHNLYTEYDKDTPNKLIMEPRNSFYKSTIQDWTQKRDLSKELEIVPMGALQARYYKFTYKEDKDYYNAKYLSENGEIYGQKKVTVDNDFLVNEHKEELPFSPTPMDSSSAQALNVPIVSNNDRYFPKIINVDNQGKVTARVSNPRILYYGGVKPCKPWRYGLTNNPSSSGVTNYPYCGHMDDAIAPTLDLNFGLLKEVYYEPAFNAIISDNNLYNTYWKQEIDEITDKNSSIVTGWFRLTPKDIALVDFSHVYRFDFQNFRLNKIYDYNPLKDGLTKCEFIKIKLGIPFTASTGNLTGGSNATIGTVTPLPLPFPKPKKNKGWNSSISSTISNIISGKYNTVPPSCSGIIITGDNNTIGENAKNITALNSSGCVVPGGISEVFILNSSGVTVTSSNTIVMNNQTYRPSPGYKRYSALLTQTLTNAPVATVLENSLSGPIVWTYDGVGSYTGTLTSAFTANKTTSIVGGSNNTLDNTTFIFCSTYGSVNTVGVSTFYSGGQSNSVLNNTLIQITVYD